MGTMAVGTDRRLKMPRRSPGLTVHAFRVGIEDLLVAAAAGDSGYGLEGRHGVDEVGPVAVGADRRVNVAPRDAS